MSFISKICCCGGKTIKPDDEFNLVLSEGMNMRGKGRGRYGVAYERMTSPGREALRDHQLTPEQNKPKAKIKPKIKREAKDYSYDEEVVETFDNKGRKHIESKKKANSSSQDHSSIPNNFKNKEENKYQESSENGAKEIDNSFDFGDAFNRIDRSTKTQNTEKDGIKDSVIYAIGPITKYVDSPLKIPVDKYEEQSVDYSKFVVVKI
jgi:hypothetical protein